MTSEVVNSSLQLSKTEILARTNCAGCFGPTSPGDNYTPRSSVKDSLVVCLDGNFQHRHNAKAGASAPLSIPPVFLDPKRVDSMRDNIANLAVLDEPVRFPKIFLVQVFRRDITNSSVHPP
jgi:RNase P subunit RPR2